MAIPPQGKASLDLIVRLGREFARRGMTEHARKLRLYFLAMKRGFGGARGSVEKGRICNHGVEGVLPKACGQPVSAPGSDIDVDRCGTVSEAVLREIGLRQGEHGRVALSQGRMKIGVERKGVVLASW